MLSDHVEVKLDKRLTRRLCQYYGRDSDLRISYATLSSLVLKNGGNVRTPSELRTLADELANAETPFNANSMFSEIDTQNNIVNICCRLHTSLRYKWRDHVMRRKRESSEYLRFSYFVNFVKEQADVVNDPIYGYDSLSDTSAKSNNHRSVAGFSASTNSKDAVAGRSTYDRHIPIVCSMYKENHKLFYCPRFGEMSVAARIEYVADNILYNNCLIAGHTAHECRKPFICRVNGCNRNHSRLLHVDNTVSNHNASVNVDCHDMTNNHVNIFMPTVPVIVNNTQYVHALHDTGSSNSFCSRKLVDTLQIKGSKTTYQLNTLTSSFSRDTITVFLNLMSVDGKEVLHLNNVLVTDEIPLQRSSCDISQYQHLQGIDVTSVDAIDILIGQDNPTALVPYEVKRGPVGPFATRTLFGWSLNGIKTLSATSYHVVVSFISTSLLEERVAKLYDVENEGIDTSVLGLSPDDQKVI